MSTTVRQGASAFAAAAATTYTGTLSSAALAGSLVVLCAAGDKDVGTWTGDPTAANLRSTSVSLILAYYTAVGGETTITGTVGANIAGANLYVLELVDTRTGTWIISASATHNSDESNVTVWSSGTTGTASIDGLAIAVFSADSVNTAGTAGYSNSFVSQFDSANGSTQAGLWVATKAISAGNTAESTLTRTGGTADQHSGAIVIFARQLAGQATSTTTVSTTATARAAGTATSSTTVSVTATAVFPATAPTQTTTITATATARTPGTASSSTAITVTASARLAGTASSSTTITTTAAARLAGAATPTTTITVTASARTLGTSVTVTTVHVTARARDANFPVPTAPFGAGAPTLDESARLGVGQATIVAGWSAGAVVAS